MVTINSSGAVSRVKTADGFGTGHVYLTGVSATDDGAAISGAMTSALGQFDGMWFGGWSVLGSRAALVMTINDAGAPTWAKRVGGTARDYGYAVSLFRDGFVALAGEFQRNFLSSTSPVPSAGGSEVIPSAIVRFASAGANPGTGPEKPRVLRQARPLAEHKACQAEREPLFSWDADRIALRIAWARLESDTKTRKRPPSGQNAPRRQITPAICATYN